MPRLPYRRPFRISSFTLACSSSRSARVGRSLAKGEPGLVSQSQEWYPKSQELHKTCLHSQIRDGKTKIRSRILKIRCGCEATPRWVRGHTQMGARAHRDGCEGTPRWVRGHTKMGARSHQDGCEAIPRWVRGHTEMGARPHRDGCEATPRWVRGHTEMGARPHRDGRRRNRRLGGREQEQTYVDL
jgi:hypothetical protein